MPPFARQALTAAISCVAMATSACVTPPSVAPTLVAGSQATIDGAIGSIDTDPWAYDGNAVVMLDTTAHGRVAVHLPARWNLCKAGQVDIGSLAVGQRARAIGSVTDDGHVVVCERAEHRLAPMD